MSLASKDPVCGMFVDAHEIEVVYAEVHYAFCSEQCHERFVANPHLYIGYPGHKAPKLRGIQALKWRRFKLEYALTSLESEQLIEGLRSMMGVRKVHVNNMILEITYDLMEVTAEQIEKRLVEIGLGLGEEWPERLRRSFINFVEEFEISGLDEPPNHLMAP